MKIRKIKFKAKRLDNGEWVEGDLKHSTSYIGIGYPSSAFPDVPVVHRVDPSSVCQFTGLKDCKGNEIWEHDLIHFVGYKPTAEVIWSEENYAFMVASENEPLYWLSDVLEIGKIERVGNTLQEIFCKIFKIKFITRYDTMKSVLCEAFLTLTDYHISVWCITPSNDISGIIVPTIIVAIFIWAIDSITIFD
jgi:hypothetical protein